MTMDAEATDRINAINNKMAQVVEDISSRDPDLLPLTREFSEVKDNETHTPFMRRDFSYPVLR